MKTFDLCFWTLTALIVLVFSFVLLLYHPMTVTETFCEIPRGVEGYWTC